ncbi:MAG: CusA/CzcA family heavy metal efflux transporter, partial [Verrucomicrobiales bacterium]|nr:CusA/CzcA family heavy metal efflux transporter [Verrucomicrobiales bacterium]
MLSRLIHLSLKFRGVVIALALLLVGYGIHVASTAKLDVFPNFVPPQVGVQAEAPGLSPEQVESLVTRPIENAINGLGNLESLRSESIPGLSVITVVFKEGTDIFLSRQMLAEKLSGIARDLPTTVKPPTMSPLTSATMDLLKVGFVSDKLTPMELRTLVDWTIKPRMLSVPGVAHCNVFGGSVRQLQIQVLPDRLIAYGLSMADVVTAARGATGILGAGFFEDSNQRIVVETEGESQTVETLGNVVIINKDGGIIPLKEVAVVKEGPEPKFGDALIQGKAGVLLAATSQYGANTMDVTLAVEDALKEMQPLLDKEGVTLHGRLHRPATFIEVSLKNIKHSLFMGGLLVAVILFFFLGHFRTAFISLTAIPMSLLAAIIVMEKFGITLNTITLGGLAIAIG